jgi:hypothetical protein
VSTNSREAQVQRGNCIGRTSARPFASPTSPPTSPQPFLRANKPKVSPRPVYRAVGPAIKLAGATSRARLRKTHPHHPVTAGLPMGLAPVLLSATFPQSCQQPRCASGRVPPVHKCPTEISGPRAAYSRHLVALSRSYRYGEPQTSGNRASFAAVHQVRKNILYQIFRVAGGLGFEPRLAESELLSSHFHGRT